MNSTLTVVLRPGRTPHTACMRVCGHRDSHFPNLRTSAAHMVYHHWLRPPEQVNTV